MSCTLIKIKYETKSPCSKTSHCIWWDLLERSYCMQKHKHYYRPFAIFIGVLFYKYEMPIVQNKKAIATTQSIQFVAIHGYLLI